MKKFVQSVWQRFCNSEFLPQAIGLAIGIAFAILLVFALCGCPKPAGTSVPSYEEARNTVLKEAPFIRKPIEERQALKCQDKAVPLRKDVSKGIPYTGSLITNNKAECLIAIRAERNRLRKELSAERLRTRVKQIINDAAIKRLAEEARPTWWQQHSWKVLAPLLMTAGGALVVAVMYALTGGKSIAVSTNAFIKP